MYHKQLDRGQPVPICSVCHFVSFLSSVRFMDIETFDELECVTHVPGCLFYLRALLFIYAVIARRARVHSCALITVGTLLKHCIIRACQSHLQPFQYSLFMVKNKNKNPKTDTLPNQWISYPWLIIIHRYYCICNEGYMKIIGRGMKWENEWIAISTWHILMLNNLSFPIKMAQGPISQMAKPKPSFVNVCLRLFTIGVQISNFHLTKWIMSRLGHVHYGAMASLPAPPTIHLWLT